MCAGIVVIRGEWWMGWEQVMMQNLTEDPMGLESEEPGFMSGFVK